MGANVLNLEEDNILLKLWFLLKHMQGLGGLSSPKRKSCYEIVWCTPILATDNQVKWFTDCMS